jgi:hypothetical protein
VPGETFQLPVYIQALKKKVYLVRFQVLTAVNMKMTVFWDVAPVVWWKFTDVSDVLTASVIRAHRPDDGDNSTSETSVNFHHTTQRNISGDSHLHTVSSL